MDGSEFFRKVRRMGKRQGVAVYLRPEHGKGSHARLYYGDRFTTLKEH